MIVRNSLALSQDLLNDATHYTVQEITNGTLGAQS